jgi:hypothetical protein
MGAAGLPHERGRIGAGRWIAAPGAHVGAVATTALALCWVAFQRATQHTPRPRLAGCVGDKREKYGGCRAASTRQ